MKNFYRYFYITIFILFFIACKKEIRLSQPNNTFGTVFGAGGDMSLSGVLQTPDKNYILYGTTYQFNNLKSEGFILKVDADFNIQWYHHYGRKSYETFSGLALDDEGNMLASGITSSFGSPADINLAQSNTLIYLTYISKDGLMIWDTCYQPNPGKKNDNTTISSVLFLPNKTFCVSGITFNYETDFGSFVSTTPDNYVLGVNKQGKNLWWGRYYSSNFSSFIGAFEWDGNSIVTDDGNIVLRYSKQTEGNSNDYYVKLINIPGTGPLLPDNSYNWISDEIHCNGDLGPGEENNMEKLPGGGMVMYDYLIKGLDFTDNKGNITKQVLFKNKTIIRKIQNTGTELILTTGSDPKILNANKTAVLNPGWIIMDLKGNIQKEIYVKNTEGLDNIDFRQVFRNDKNEMLAFGTMKVASGTIIVMLRFNQEGRLIK